MSILHVSNHAIDRLMERYGLSFTPEEWRGAVLAIIESITEGSGPAVLIARIASENEKWAVRIRGRTVVVAYNPRMAMIITVLGMEMMNSHRKPLSDKRQWISGRVRRGNRHDQNWREAESDD